MHCTRLMIWKKIRQRERRKPQWIAPKATSIQHTHTHTRTHPHTHCNEWPIWQVTLAKMEGSGKIFLGPHSLHINHGRPSPLCLPHSFCQRSCTTRERDSSSFLPPLLHSGAAATGQTSKWKVGPCDVSLESPSWVLQVRFFMLSRTLCRHTAQIVKVGELRGHKSCF